VSKEAKPDAWMPLYVGDWDGDTGHLDCEQDGAYGRLIRFYWRTGPLPDDDAALSRIIRMPLARWRKVRPVIAAFFTVADGVWRHKRADHERVEWARRKERATERAKQAAEKRWKSDARSNATSMPGAMLEQCPSPSPSSTEVEAPKRASTLCGPNGSFARLDGANAPPGEPVDWTALVIANLEKQERTAGEKTALSPNDA
jgi:uncharacterized protein YdaU (DUF1376 family)